uniref:Uncharacterized protein n=1 Tax=Ditylenchus dipsaci TaxID=166011 RepID=A0A915EUM4_9BILA
MSEVEDGEEDLANGYLSADGEVIENEDLFVTFGYLHCALLLRKNPVEKLPLLRASSKPDAYVASNVSFDYHMRIVMGSQLRVNSPAIGRDNLYMDYPLNEAAENFSLDGLQVNTDAVIWLSLRFTKSLK